MKTILSAFLLLTLAASAQAQPALQAANDLPPVASPSAIYTNAIIRYLGVPRGASLDVVPFGTFVPSFHGNLKDKLGYGILGNYKPDASGIIGYQVGLQYLNISKQEPNTFQPNGMLTFSKAFHAGPITLTPLGEFGGAIDSKFMDPHGIIGAGGAVGWRGFSLWGGGERWSGARSSFTAIKAGVAYTISF